MSFIRGLARIFHVSRRRRSKEVPASTESKRIKLVNRVGKTLTPLAVYGYVDIGGRKYEARSKRFVYIRKGTQIKVVGRENFAYLVEAV